MNLRHRVLALFVGLSAAAHAADVTFNYNFTVSSIHELGGSVPLGIAPFSGSFGGTFTPIPGFGTNASTLTSFNLTINGFTYTPALVGLEVLGGHAVGGGYEADFSLGGLLNGPGSLVSGTNDFFFSIHDYPNGTGISDFTYSSFPNRTTYVGSLTFARISSVPDFGSALSLLAIGFLTLAAVARAKPVGRGKRPGTAEAD
jgi:hypothetical protein